MNKTLAILALAGITACTTTKVEYIEREVEKVKVNVVHDTLRESNKDSIYHTIIQKGDTVYDTKYVERIWWRDKIVVKTDTFLKDSIVTDYKETIKEVVKYPKTYWATVCISILFFIFAFVKLIKWIQTL